MFAYLGFEQADQLAGEIKNPQKNLPIAIIGSIIIGAVIYILLQIVLIGATPASLLTGKGFAGIASTNGVAIAPFAALAALGGCGWLSSVLRVDAVISPAAPAPSTTPPPRGWPSASPGTGTSRRSSPP